MNFDYLKNIEELQNLYIAVSSDNQTDSAYLRCIKYGRCLESLVRYTYAKHFPKYKAASSELIKLLKDKTFKQFLGKTEYYNKLHFTYLAGNNAAFDHDIDKETADLALENLKEVTFQIFSKLNNFDETQKRTFEYVSKVEYSITEAKTRELYIDTNLKSAGYSVAFYQTTLQKMFSHITKIYYSVTTEDIRLYLSNYQDTNKVSKSTIDNMRRIISSFFSWLESEDYIVKSPARRIHKVKTPKLVKEVFSDESIELMRQNCKNPRDLAIIDLLYSTGIRVGELVRLDISDVDFSNKECIVFGKGDKQRKVYFDAKTKIHLQQYIETRKDNNPALFVSLLYPYNRLKVSGVEIALRKIGEHLEIGNVHPHKFRRTLATKAIDKGMPIEQVQHLLGHAKIDTTLEYAMVDDENVKISHKKYLG